MRAEQSLATSEARFRATFEQAAVGIGHVGLDGRWLRVNDRLCAITGYPRDELLRRTFQEITHPDDLDTDVALAAQLLAGEIATYTLEKRYLRRDGSLLWVNLTVSLLRDETGRPRHFISVVEDIDARKRAESALLESESRLRIAIDAARMSIWEWDHARDVRRSHGVIDEPYRELPGSFSEFMQIVHPDDRARVWDAAHHAVEASVPYEPEYRILRPDGSVIWIATRGQLVHRADGPPLLVGVAMDVTERKATEEALVASEARFRSLADALPQIVFTSDPETGLDYVNRRWLEFTGLSVEETLGTGGRVAIHPDDLPGVIATWTEATRTGEAWEREFRLREHTGAYCWFLSRVVPIKDPAGRVVRWFGTSTDIDGRKRAEQALARSERLFRSLAAATAQVIWTLDADGRSDQAVALQGIDGQLWITFTGQASDTADGRGWMEAIHPEDRSRVDAEWDAGIAARAPFAVEYRLRRHDGAWRVVVDRAVPVQDEAGAIERWIGTVTDVTDAREAEADVRRSNARLRRIFDANVVGACFFRQDGAITDANDALLEMLNVGRERVRAGELNWRDLTPPIWREADERAARELRETGACTPFEKAYRRADGGEVPVLVAAALFPGSEDEGIALIIDLTDRKERERFEQEFLAGVAHDLKNPLAAMKAQTQLMRRRLRGGRLTPEGTDQGLAAVEHNISRVATRLEELMDVALLRAGHELLLRREAVDLIALVRGRTESYRQATDHHRIEIDAPPEPLVGHWDATRVERIVDNLFSNAIKYSPGGGTIHARLRRVEEAGAPFAELAVTDQGIGIPAADLPHIFQRLRRATNAQGLVRGAGIGLAGARQLVDLHGGTITAESEEGRGSRFTLRLPLEEQ